MFSEQPKKRLKGFISRCYVSVTATLLVVGRENPEELVATISAESAFFVVVKPEVIECRSMVWCIESILGVFCIHSLDRVYHTTKAMVAVAGQSSDWSVSANADILTPVTAITIERENSGDSMNILLAENAIMATTPAPKHPKYDLPQLSYDCRRKIQRAKEVSFFLSFDLINRDIGDPVMFLPHILAYIKDDIADIDKELTELGLFNKATGK